jgi:hypothetical protein
MDEEELLKLKDQDQADLDAYIREIKAGGILSRGDESIQIIEIIPLERSGEALKWPEDDYEIRRWWKPMGVSQETYEIDIEFYSAVGAEDGVATGRSRATLLADGRVLAATSQPEIWMLIPETETRGVCIDGIERTWIEFLSQCSQLFSLFKVKGPYLARIGLLNLPECKLYLSPRNMANLVQKYVTGDVLSDSHLIERIDDCTVFEIAAGCLRPLLNDIWKAFGLRYCRNFDGAGRWTGDS